MDTCPKSPKRLLGALMGLSGLPPCGGLLPALGNRQPAGRTAWQRNPLRQTWPRTPGSSGPLPTSQRSGLVQLGCRHVVQNVPLQLYRPTGSALQGCSMKGSLPCCWQFQEELAMLRHNLPDYCWRQLRPTGVISLGPGQKMGQESVLATSLFRGLALQLLELVGSSGLYPCPRRLLEEMPTLVQGRPSRQRLD